ncbi:MAG: hypothetical protein ACRC9X_06430 [Bacteroidales bacterium]
MTVYHTQEKRKNRLTTAIKCTRDDAWLGEAYYFWKEEFDALNWGNSSKRGAKYFEIYQCELTSENYLDTVFNEEHYYFWLKQLEKIAKKITVKTGKKPTLKELNDYIKDKNLWTEVEFIQFQDLPTNTEQALVLPIEYRNKKIRTVAFRKRIQIAVYNSAIISNFLLKETHRVS